MIQDIGKLRYRNEYKNYAPEADSRILCYHEHKVLASYRDGELSFLTYRQLQERRRDLGGPYTYLFEIDGTAYFLAGAEALEQERSDGGFPELSWQPIEVFRTTLPKEAAFAAVTGYQLAGWYDSRKFCPRCGRPMVHGESERMMHCTSCGLVEYPKICPAVIVGVIEDDKILLTKYAGRAFKKYALIAGFAEIGESIEDTVRREVLEEVGLHVKNIRYYKSQPWSFTSTLLMGFFCEVDGADEIHLDLMELSEAKWCTRDEVPEDDGISLTREMMQVFRLGKVPEDAGSRTLFGGHFCQV